MKTELQDMRKKAIELLKKPGLDNPSVLELLAKLPAELQQMERDVEGIESRMSRIKGLLQGFAADGQKNGSFANHVAQNTVHPPRGDISIRIDRKLLGLPGGVETICERWEADSLVRFVELLHQARGISVLEKLCTLRVNRGPLLSNNPSQDYGYHTHRGRNKTYAHKSIAGTSYSVLTNNSCDEKVDCINAACTHLGLPVGAVTVERKR